MKLFPYPRREGYNHATDRPDYKRILRASYGTQKQRIAVAERLFLDGHRDCRALDNCFEMNDGDAVVAAIIGHALQNDALRRAIAADYPPHELQDGLPRRWLATYYAVHGHELPLMAA